MTFKAMERIEPLADSRSYRAWAVRVRDDLIIRGLEAAIEGEPEPKDQRGPRVTRVQGVQTIRVTLA